MHTGRSDAPLKLRSSGRTRATSSRRRRISTRSSKSSAPAFSTRPCRPRPPRRPRNRATAANRSVVGDVSRGLTGFAPAKVNLALRVLGRRANGYHEIESLVAFADIADRLTVIPVALRELVVQGA